MRKREIWARKMPGKVVQSLRVLTALSIGHRETLHVAQPVCGFSTCVALLQRLEGGSIPEVPTALTHNISPGIKLHPKLLGSIVQPWVVLGNQSLDYTVWPFV